MQRHSDRIRLVWLTPKFPLGVPDGARHATCALMRHLIHLGVKVDLISLIPAKESADPSAAIKSLGVSSSVVIRRPASFFGSWNVPFTFRTFVAPSTQKNLHAELTRVLASDQRRHTLILLDGLHLFAALAPQDMRILLKRCDGMIYRAHNYETALWEQSAAQTRLPWARWFLTHQASKVREFERRIARNVTLIAPVSDQDAARFQTQAPNAAITTVPIGTYFPDEAQVEPITPNPSFEILFVGRLDWIPNKTGLKWFLQQVWPRVITARPNARLTIAGVGERDWLNRFKWLPAVRILGHVADLEDVYRRCAISIAPLFQGSGTRVKILEAARYARPVLSTALGAEGSGLVSGHSYYQAETADQWYHALRTLTLEECRGTGWNAFRESRERFDAKSIAERFQHVLQGYITSLPDRSISYTMTDDLHYVRTG